MNAATDENPAPGASATPLPDASMPATAETGLLLRWAHARAVDQLSAALPDGLQPRYHDVLAALTELGPRSQQQLAERLGINRTIMVSLIDAMEGAGLVRRERDPADRRSYALVPSEAGASALAAMELAADRANRRLIAPLSDPERRRLDQLLRAIVTAAGGFDERPAALSRRTVQLISLAHHAVSRSFAQRLKAVGLTPPLYGTLRTLDASGPTSQQAIAEQLGLSGTAILQTVDRLEADQLVKRHRNPNDRRSYALAVTPQGRLALSRAATARAAQRDELDSALGGNRQQQQLRDLLLGLLDPSSRLPEPRR